ncbi:outer membrane protein OmpA-like peptidoglycan-associated protein [Chryseobacterium defluvii]|uniref:Outer membrane protein OmpA-like peptidoglycan-associated protein n=1 Tax=Chryseobacterium defluvii TaxID=160396 RepID=A0A840K7X9_9FLAO|nr:OmpA family protein [Chryseobacterium defluvii]MBB4805611.1 outer membrane protein OmpA-like peptidoglycan-associated protein [Chryseobacterium defluvii]
MRKLIICLAVASLAVSCKKIQAGGNKGTLKLEEGVERYSDDVRSSGHGHGSASEGHGSEHAEKKPQVSIDLNGTALKGFANGMEDSMIKYLKSGSYATATEEGLKDVWYNFDNVNFKTGSANQLEAGSHEQLDNLAKILKAYPDVKIKIGGYTDKTGDEAKNVKLSLDRANFIKAELTKAGAGGQIVSAEGYGSKFATVDAKASDAERASDRKMAVRFTK